jgi:hypothetical protein
MARRTTSKSATSKRATRYGRAEKRDEKVRVKETERTVPVKPVRAPRPGPTNPAAIDRRRQIVGTDELPTASSRPRKR